MKIRSIFTLIALCPCFTGIYGQDNRPHTASFVGRMGVDTVLIETYSMINNHLYGKAFIRVPEDYISVFSIHFYPDGSIREFDVMAMDPSNSSVPFQAISNVFEYRLNMNCQEGTCTFYNSEKGRPTEWVVRHEAPRMDFVGGWVPLISLMEWNSMRLKRSEKQHLPLKMINHNIGVYDIGVQYQSPDIVLFGGPFLEYTRIKTDDEGRIISTDGTGTPWNYHVTKHAPIDIDQVARRMAKTPGIGLPSPTETVQAVVHNTKIELSYGRPFKRGRAIFGSVVPYDSLWRTGAGGPTKITLGKAIRIGKTRIPEGQYSLYTVPKPTEWLLIFNTDLERWPTDPNRAKDIAQVVIPAEKSADHKDQFTIEVQETRKGGLLKFQWDDTTAVADFEVINSK